MKISEIFLSIQGEGLDTGLPTVFIRTAGCNLKCAWCDTKYALRGGTETGIDDILKRVRAFKCRRICVTGGEPLAQPETMTLLRRLLSRGYDVSVLTNGSLPVGPLFTLPHMRYLRISMDIKCPSSKMQTEMDLTNIARLRAVDQLKFVVRDMKDYAHAKRILSRHRTRATVIFQPVWGARGASVAEAMLKDGLDARVMVQMHKVLWGERARGK
jgi:7-carboxy-7-deazaguanine synthase